MHLLVLLASMCDHEISSTVGTQGMLIPMFLRMLAADVQRVECQKGGQRLQDSSAKNITTAIVVAGGW